eukprot:2595433-Amphidinium_carterae.1
MKMIASMFCQTSTQEDIMVVMKHAYAVILGPIASVSGNRPLPRTLRWRHSATGQQAKMQISCLSQASKSCG